LHLLLHRRDLIELQLSGNELEGPFLDSVGNLSIHLHKIIAASNYIGGAIPVGFGNFSSLFLIDLRSNELDRDIPVAITRLDMLQVLFMAGNKIRGANPFDVGEMAYLYILGFEANQFL